MVVMVMMVVVPTVDDLGANGRSIRCVWRTGRTRSPAVSGPVAAVVA